MAAVTDMLRLTETFLSLQGEGEHAGLLCYFIRTAGCDLRCRWCDTDYSWTGGVKHSLDDIVAGIPDGVTLVQITGGEPLLQRDAVIELMKRLLPGYRVLLETGGHRSIKGLPQEVHIVLDIKLPGSNEAHHDFAANLPFLKSSDEIKFVISNREDYEAARFWMAEHCLHQICKVLVSPVFGEIAPSDLAGWVIEDRLPVRMQLQQHKLIWGANRRGV
jgi:7-carboxy-7-deazaguanine synthase